MAESPWSRREVLTLAVVFEGGLGLLAWPLGWWRGESPLASWRWDAGGLLLGVLAAAPMIVAGLVLARWPVGPMRAIAEFVDEVVRPVFARCRWYDLAGISALAGFAEEVLFRGVVQPALAGWWGPAAGLVLAGVLFGLVHPITWLYAVLAALAGTYLGAVWWATGNLLVPATAHGMYDFAMLLWLLRGPSGPGAELRPSAGGNGSPTAGRPDGGTDREGAPACGPARGWVLQGGEQLHGHAAEGFLADLAGGAALGAPAGGLVGQFQGERVLEGGAVTQIGPEALGDAAVERFGGQVVGVGVEGAAAIGAAEFDEHEEPRVLRAG